MNFKTIDDAEEYFWANLARHSEDYIGRDNWIEEQDIFDQHDCHLSPEDGCNCIGNFN